MRVDERYIMPDSLADFNLATPAAGPSVETVSEMSHHYLLRRLSRQFESVLFRLVSDHLGQSLYLSRFPTHLSQLPSISKSAQAYHCNTKTSLHPDQFSNSDRTTLLYLATSDHLIQHLTSS